MSTPRPGPTSSTTSSGPSSASLPMTPRMFSSTRKCWPRSRFGRRHVTGARTRLRRSPRSAPRARRRPRRAPRRARRPCARRSPARSGGRGRGCGARYGLSVSARMRSAGTCARGGAQLVGLRVRDVAGERDVVAALERRRQRRRRREAVQDDRAVEAGEHVARVSASASRVWMTTGLPSSLASSSCASNSARCAVARRVVAEVVETGLADGDRRVVLEQLAELVDAPRFRRRRPGAGGFRARRRPPRGARASSSAARHDSIPVPTVMIRSTPAARARRISADGRSAHASRCAWVSITRFRRPAAACARAPRRPPLGVELLEERPGLARAWPGGSSLGAQLADPRLVVARQDLVDVVVLADLAQLERPGDRHPRSRAARGRVCDENGRNGVKHRLQAVDRAQRDVEDGRRALAVALRSAPTAPGRSCTG